MTVSGRVMTRGNCPYRCFVYPVMSASKPTRSHRASCLPPKLLLMSQEYAHCVCCGSYPIHFGPVRPTDGDRTAEHRSQRDALLEDSVLQTTWDFPGIIGSSIPAWFGVPHTLETKLLAAARSRSTSRTG